MFKKGKGSMGDEDSTQPRARQLQRRPKIIIRKCKKTPTVPVAKSLDDSKKINGELSAEKKSKQNDDVGGEGMKTYQLDPEPAIKGVKRKQPETVEVNLEDESTFSEDKNDKETDRTDNSSPVEFKGFKKRILALTEKLNDEVTDSTDQCPGEGAKEMTVDSDRKLRPRIQKTYKAKKKIPANGKKGTEGDSDENQAESQAEYAQYLGLQPTMQFKCYRCGEKGFPSMLALNMHQRGCGVSQKTNFIANLQQDTAVPPSDPSMLTNFRITRKVYLCSACGTYYENWNLFLHMRDVHKKHICLFCLTMFGVAEKLADHLKTTHSVQENTYKSSEDFQSAYKGSCYLICCSCENMFNERENYFHHQCVKRDPSAKCNICGVRCGHYYTCPNSSSTRPLNVGGTQQITATTSKPAINKFFGSGGKKKEKAAEELWMGKKGDVHGSVDTEDDYDISHAASFCHVDIADEFGEKDKSGTEDNPVEIEDDDSEPLTSGKNTSEESSSAEPTEQTNDESASTKGDTQTVENEPNLIIESETITSKEPVEVGNTIVETSETEEKEKAMEDDNTDKLDQEHPKINLRDENLVEKDTHLETDENKGENDKEDTVSQEVSSKNLPENDSPHEAVISDQIETDEISKRDVYESQPDPQKDKSDSTSSDSDGEPGTHLSVSQEDSGSSSDESSDGDKKAESKKLMESNKNESVGESEDSSKSGAFASENLKSDSIETPQGNKTKPNDNFSGQEDILQETQSSTSNDASKDIHLNEICEEDNEAENGLKSNKNQQESLPEEVNDGIPLAGEDVPAMALTLEDKLEDASPQSVVKECVRTSCLNCVYCSHAIKIAVNGKQLALHLLAEHRYKPVKNNETSQDVVKKLKNSLTDLESLFFNTDSYDSSDKSLNTSYDYTYECFQCRFVTKVHKELYVHKRKMHQKTVLLCVMCKSNFYSYSELLCHMCPGIYVSEDINFRCCFCNLDMIPSAFRLMVHLRKSHHTCDICLEVAGDQQKLSTHMWKHKLNHLCYRCGIAYRNKPDITKHLFWKHGTESVLCKKCLQKKWPHVYHFCIPPTVFICEECNASFTRAVALKVHKRFHGGELPYGCTKCEQKFVSKKLLAKHEDSHNKPPPTETSFVTKSEADKKHSESADENVNVESIDEPVQEPITDINTKEVQKENDSQQHAASELKSKKKKKKEKDKKEKPVLDVYDLPPLNLSSESDSSDEETKPQSETSKEKQPQVGSETCDIQPETNENLEIAAPENSESYEETQAPAQIVDGVWDNFHVYKAELEKRESKDLSLPNILPSTSSEEPKIQSELIPEKEPKSPTSLVLLDHSYSLISGKSKPNENVEENSPNLELALSEDTAVEVSEASPAPRGHSSSIDHAYATLTTSIGEATTDQTPTPISTTPPPCSTPQVETHSSSKKKQKTPKKKKHNTNSSSSSDSSSDTDSSSCTCQSNCSCSGSSSNTSSSSSSDSESSTSEGRRRVAAKREKKKERLREKHLKEESAPKADLDGPPLLPPQEEESVVDVPLEPVELPVRESDLDTDESSTDEDFYDKYPQSHAKQQMEKRNKLMLLASVAPVNNGTVSPPPPPPEEKPTPPPPTTKRKIKTKKRRKSQQTKKSSNKGTSVPNQTQPSTSVSLPMATSTPSSTSTNHHNLTAKVTSPLRIPHVNFQPDVTGGSGSENESARLSKRKRVRNKFYGYSSEEEDEERQEKPHVKWRKVDPAPTSQGVSFQPSLSLHRTQTTIRRPKPSDSSGTEDDPPTKKEEFSNSSSSSSESETELDTKGNLQNQTEKSDNLYCYCQCPYDEVSEMIACDGQDCTIEWFHFECVGIMVPPKGKWYCPDCRKRRDLM